MSIVTDPAILRHEVRIVWIDGAAVGRPFLRECVARTARRTGGSVRSMRPGTVAYAELGPTARGSRGSWRPFERRTWYSAEHDFTPGAYTDADGLTRDAPIEGVIPETIAPGRESMPAGPELWERPRSAKGGA